MIRSLLDIDLYKFTQQQAFAMLYPYVEAKYKLIFREKEEELFNWLKKNKKALDWSFKYNSKFTLSCEEYNFLKKQNLFNPFYLDFLSKFHLDYKQILEDYSVTGSLYKVMIWETVIMSTISEFYMEGKSSFTKKERHENNENKLRRLKENNVKFIEGGTRRRYSYKVQDEFVEQASKYDNFLGTSNVHLAMKHNVPAKGTYAHEWVMLHGYKHGPIYANEKAMTAWQSIYGTKLPITLTDTYTTNTFLWNFNSSYFYDRFNGVRQDSGDPFEFAYRMINWYQVRGINPKEKTIVFSDSLTTEKAIELQKEFEKDINCIFLIGGHFTNDVGIKPLNMVVKMTECRKDSKSEWQGTVKLSDDKSKETGTKENIKKYRKQVEDYLK